MLEQETPSNVKNREGSGSLSLCRGYRQSQAFACLQLRMDHLQAAGLFARGQEATLCAMTDFETGLALEMSSRICKTVRVYHSSLTRAMSLTGEYA